MAPPQNNPNNQPSSHHLARQVFSTPNNVGCPTCQANNSNGAGNSNGNGQCVNNQCCGPNGCPRNPSASNGGNRPPAQIFCGPFGCYWR